ALALLGWRRGRHTFGWIGAGAAFGLLAAACWGYVLNVAHTGHLLGHGQGRVEQSAATTLGGTVSRSLHLVYRLFDLSVMPNWLIVVLVITGYIVAVVAFKQGRRADAAALVLFAPAVTAAVLAIFDPDPSDVPPPAAEGRAPYRP